MHSPIEQFEIQTLSPTLFSLGGHPIAFTTATLYMLVAVVLATSFMILTMRKRAVVPGRWQYIAEMFYNLVADMVRSGAGEKAMPFFPFIFSIFMFVFFCNLLGMFPHVLTVTAQLVTNLALAGTLFSVIVITGFVRHGTHFLRVFVPEGVPAILLPFMVLIEFVSFWVRPCSLSIRLFGNMLAGHILMKVFAGMTAGIAVAGWVAPIGVLPLLLNTAVIGFEFFVAFLQAYIFAILASVYLRDAIELH